MSSRLTTSSVVLFRFLTNKATQARKIVQWTAIAPILRDARSLIMNVVAMQDGMKTGDKALKNAYDIQTGVMIVNFAEQDLRPKKGETVTLPDGTKKKPKPKKHYGFDFYNCAIVDEMCDDIIAQVCAFGQNHQPYNRG